MASNNGRWANYCKNPLRRIRYDFHWLLCRAILNHSEFKQQDSRKKRTAKACVWQTWQAKFLYFFVVIFTYVNVFFFFCKKTCLKKGEVRRKRFSKKIIVTLVTQGLPSSFPSSCCLPHNCSCNGAGLIWCQTAYWRKNRRENWCHSSYLEK